jgi:hypothetical protein
VRIGLALLALAGCREPRVVSPVPVGEPVVTCPAAPEAVDDPTQRERASRLAEVRRELAAVDDALDALDAELAAAAAASGPSRDDVAALATTRTALLRTATIDNLHPDAPSQLHRLAHAHLDALHAKAELDAIYGARHPRIVELVRSIDWLRGAFDRQRAVELAETTAWRDELAALPRGAPPAKVQHARLRAQLATIEHFAADAIAPSDAPAELRLAVDRAADAARAIDELSPSLGPKHPEMVRLAQLRTDAAADIRAAVESARKELELAGTRPATQPIDASKLAKRVELATRARELRKELAALGTVSN